MANGMFLGVLGLGFVLGLKHALDPDHMVAVSTIVSESKSIRRSSLVGTFWGLGHTTSLFIRRNHVTMRILDQFDIHLDVMNRWDGTC